VEAAVAKALDRYGSLHVLFNNAGGGARAIFPKESEEEWERVLRVNLTGTILMCRAVWPHLITAGGGVIINMSSLAAVAGVSETVRETTQAMPSASYFASEAGIEAFTCYLAELGASHNIRVNCVRPGQILTSRLTTATGKHRYARHFEVVQLLKGPGRAADVANTVLFLASEEARFITAEVINIDGGAAAKL
jgi:3-oxoacyl-[acyl-carrier protein] reductase